MGEGVGGGGGGGGGGVPRRRGRSKPRVLSAAAQGDACRFGSCRLHRACRPNLTQARLSLQHRDGITAFSSGGRHT